MNKLKFHSFISKFQNKNPSGAARVGGEKCLNQYKVYLENNETAIITAEDFEIILTENEGQRRLVFNKENHIIAVFNWSKIVGVECL
jgi:hypothetical protein